MKPETIGGVASSMAVGLAASRRERRRQKEDINWENAGSTCRTQISLEGTRIDLEKIWWSNSCILPKFQGMKSIVC